MRPSFLSFQDNLIADGLFMTVGGWDPGQPNQNGEYVYYSGLMWSLKVYFEKNDKHNLLLIIKRVMSAKTLIERMLAQEEDVDLPVTVLADFEFLFGETAPEMLECFKRILDGSKKKTKASPKSEGDNVVEKGESKERGKKK